MPATTKGTSPGATTVYVEDGGPPPSLPENIPRGFRDMVLERQAHMFHGAIHCVRYKKNNKPVIFKALPKCGVNTMRGISPRLRLKDTYPSISLVSIRDPVSRFLAGTNTLRNLGWDFTDEQFVEYMVAFANPLHMNIHLRPMSLFLRETDILFPLSELSNVLIYIGEEDLHLNKRKDPKYELSLSLTSLENLENIYFEDRNLYIKAKSSFKNPVELLDRYNDLFNQLYQVDSGG